MLMFNPMARVVYGLQRLQGFLPLNTKVWPPSADSA